MTRPGFADDVASPSAPDWQAIDIGSGGGQAEMAVLLHFLVDEMDDFATKVCAVQMLISAREASGDKSSDAYGRVYHDLLLGAAVACGAAISTPKALGGGATYAMLWQSALCGLVPGVIFCLEEARCEGSNPSPDDSLMNSVLPTLLNDDKQIWNGCEVYFTPAEQEHKGLQDDDSVMLDALIQDARTDPDRRPLRAMLIQSLSDKNLITSHTEQACRSLLGDEAANTAPCRSQVEADDAGLQLQSYCEQRFLAGAIEESDFLDRMTHEYATHKALAEALLNSLESWSSSADFASLSRASSTLLDRIDVMHVWLMYVAPVAVLDAVAPLLDNSEELQSSGEEPSLLGPVVLFCESVIQLAVRAGATQDRTLRRRPHRILATVVRASAAKRPLQQLPPHEQAVVGNWITSLFGSDGISDDLIRSSSPQLLLRLTPVIIAQVVTATAADVVDNETLRNGLTYFLQDLLSYTLPGVILSLLYDLERCQTVQQPTRIVGVIGLPTDQAAVGLGQESLGLQRRGKVILTVLSSLLQAESCPSAIKRLVAAHVISTLERCKLLSDEARALLSSLTPVAHSQLGVRRSDIWIKDAYFRISPDGTGNGVTFTMDPLLNLNASLFSIAVHRGSAAVVRLLGKAAHSVDVNGAPAALARTMAISIALVLLREQLEARSFDLTQSMAIQTMCAMSVVKRLPTTLPRLVRLLAATFVSNAMQKLAQHTRRPSTSGQDDAVALLASTSVIDVLSEVERLHRLEGVYNTRNVNLV